MARHLPPLNALRAFEAAARHLSFTKAAEELNVTQAAISHQVKGLEDRLGVALFRRQNRALTLTEAGQAYLPALKDAFDAIDAATARLVARDRSGAVTVTCLPSFAATWLVRRLGRFRAQHPDLDVRLLTNERLVDFAREDVDIGVRYGRGHWPGLMAEKLLTEDMFPVCAPALLKGPKPLKRPADLKHHTLLHDDMEMDWQRWLVAASVKGVDPNRGLQFSSSSMLLQAAADGQGVAMGRSALAAGYLAEGRLVRPFELKLHSDAAYYVIYSQAHAHRPKVKTFRDFLMAEAERADAQAR